MQLIFQDVCECLNLHTVLNGHEINASGVTDILTATERDSFERFNKMFGHLSQVVADHICREVIEVCLEFVLSITLTTIF
jgi:hypothetical protein